MSTIFRPILFTFLLFLISCNASNHDNIQLKAEPIATPTFTKEAATQETEISVIPSTNLTELEIYDVVQLKVKSIAAPTYYTKGIITEKGFESVMFGMTEAEIRAAFKVNIKYGYDPDYPDCYYLGDDNENIFFMIHAGIFQRIDVIDSPDIKIMGGAAIGMSFEAIEKLYPNAYRKPNFYAFPNEDLIVQLDENVKIIFEQGADEIVSNFRIGMPPSIDFVEGCL